MLILTGTGDGASDEDYTLYCCVSQAIALLQGLSLLHSATKAFLASKWIIEVRLPIIAYIPLR